MTSPIHGTFARVPPSILGKAEDWKLAPAWFVLNPRWFGQKQDWRAARGRWCRIKSAHGAVYRAVQFAPNLEYSNKRSVPAGRILIDWSAWAELSGLEEREDELALEIRPVGVPGMVSASVNHPDPGQRVAAWVAVVSLALGRLSILLAIAAFLVR